MIDIGPFLDAVKEWAASRSEVVAVGLVGSRARGAAR
jgi:hypothetical protein